MRISQEILGWTKVNIRNYKVILGRKRFSQTFSTVAFNREENLIESTYKVPLNLKESN